MLIDMQIIQARAAFGRCSLDGLGCSRGIRADPVTQRILGPCAGLQVKVSGCLVEGFMFSSLRVERTLARR